MKKKGLILLLTVVLFTSCNADQQHSTSQSTFGSQNPSSSEVESNSLSESSLSQESASSALSQESVSSALSTSQSSSESAQEWTNDDFGTYYDSIDFSKNLLNQFRTLNQDKKKLNIGYSGLWNYFDQTDYDPNHPNQYLAFYRGTSATKSQMNKEHVWPKSRGGNLVDGDIHTIRPTLTSDNSNRGNSFYVENKNSSSDGWDPKKAGMEAQYRGQAARIIFYCVIANDQLSLVDTNNDATANKTMGKLSDLLKWNLMYPVVDSEIRRNNGAQKVQGNRNPFIDNPSFACSIFGSYNDNTRQICSSTQHFDTPEDDPLPEEEEIKNGIKLTVDGLNIPAQQYVASSATVSDILFNYTELGNFGNGIQMRNKNNKHSILSNQSAIEKGIQKIVLNYSPTKTISYDNNDAVLFYFGNNQNVDAYQTTLSTKIGTTKYEIIPDITGYTYFKLEHVLGYSFYWESIIIYYNE